MARRTAAAVLIGMLALALGAQAETLSTRWGEVRLETVAQGFEHPWGLEFLEGGRLLVSERGGTLRIVEADGRLGPPLRGVPEVAVRNQGGLFDVRLAPDFAVSRRIYLSLAEPIERGSRITSTAVVHARLGEGELTEVTRIFSGQPKVEGGRHYGGRMVFSADGRYLFLGLGDRGHQSAGAQDPGSHTGSLVRIHPDGSVPADNPLVGRPDALPEIWSWGHRNIQGLAIDPASGALWATEHGPQGGDELNRPLAGRNYGWPLITYGDDYGGGKVAGSVGVRHDGMEQPVWHWTPSIAVAGIAFCSGRRFPHWEGNLLAGALRGKQLARLEIVDGRVIHQEILPLPHRIREVREGPDGYIYLLTDDGPGDRVLRLRPVD